MLLRISIGWHFLHEGQEKWESRSKAAKPFTAESYLRFSTGPLAPYFRGMVPDVNSLAKLDPVRLKAAWAADVDNIAKHYSFTADQRTAADALLNENTAFADIWFQDPGTTEKRNQYFHDLREVQNVESDLGALKNRREWAAAKRRDLDAERRELTTDLDSHAASLHKGVVALATKEQVAAAGSYSPPRTQLDNINDATTFGLIAMGLGLILGLFTRLSALAGAVFLAQIYLSMPPWPGLPASPMAEGHYLIVNKNLVEMLALLSLACLPTGQWIGLDALLFGRFRRAREQAAEERARERRRERQATARY